MTAQTIIRSLAPFVVASHRVGARRRPKTGSAKQSRRFQRAESWIALWLSLLAMTAAESWTLGATP